MEPIMRWMSFIAVAMLIGVAPQVIAQAPTTGQKPAVDAQGDALPPGAIMRLGTTRWRPGGYVSGLVFSPDGLRIASYHEEQYTTAAVTIWDVATGREVRRVEIPGIDVLFFDWLADGRGVSILHSKDGLSAWDFT